MAAEEEEKLEGDVYNVDKDEDQKHFIVIRVGDGENFTSILGNPKHNLHEMAEASRTNNKGRVDVIKKLLRPQSDPYIELTIDNPDITLRTHVVFESDTNPRWVSFHRIYIDPKQLPKTINVSAFDKSDDPDMEDAQYGSYQIDCVKQNIFDTKGNIWSNKVAINNNGSNIDIKICYDCCSSSRLQGRMKDKDISKEKLSNDTIDWICKNTPLYTSICGSHTMALQITSDMFSDIDYPPNKYRIDRHLKEFVSQYGLHDTDKKSIYFDKECDVLYVLSNESNDNNMRLGGENVTREVHLLWRFVFIKDEILAGQDAEFNIYKSYTFDPSPEKLVFSIIAVTIQLALTGSMCYEIFEGYPFGFDDGVFGDELAIKMLSAAIFVLLSIGANRTTKLYYDFYLQIGCVFDLPWLILFCDFFSNIVIPILITVISYFFLVQSESFTDLVLNSFALTFVSEIDDMVNTFDSDEEVVLQIDLRAFYKTDCVVPRRITYTWKEFAGVLWSPLGLLKSIKTGVLAIKSVFISQHHKVVFNIKEKHRK